MAIIARQDAQWAVANEIAVRHKVSHESVHYRHPSPHRDYRCGNCKNFILANPDRCRTVRNPIQHMDFCDRYKEK